MRARSRIGNCVGLLTVSLAVCAEARAQSVSPGILRTSSTLRSIGIEWPLTGDADHDATCSVQVRRQGTTAWRQAMPLVRVELNAANHLAGSVLFLEPDTAYEIALTLSDPDGGGASQTVNATTRREPALPVGGRTLHVVPGSSGGDGSQANPFRGLANAWSQARAGDVLLLHAGSYGTVSASGRPSGTAGSPIVFKAAGDGDAILEWIDLRYASWLWFDGLRFESTNAPMPAGAQDADDYTALFASLLNAGYDTGFQSMAADVNGIVVHGCTFVGYKHAVRAGPRTSGWWVTDNVIRGNRTLGMTSTPSFDGEGIELGEGNGHIVAYNRITLTADGISSPNRDCDIHNNDIFDVTDDGIELDGGEANTRAFDNRIHNAGHNGFSFQPQEGAPWYIVRNQVVNVQESMLKFREADRFVVAHNTFVNWGDVLDHWSGYLFEGMTRNNLWISVASGRIWRRCDNAVFPHTDLDYDGFDWGTNALPFNYNGTCCSNLATLESATGQETHGVRVDHRTCFDVFDVPGPPPLTTVPPQRMTLAASCPAVDAGAVVPNLSDGYTGTAPDLGAFERGTSAPLYGPRPSTGPPAAPQSLVAY